MPLFVIRIKKYLKQRKHHRLIKRLLLEDKFVNIKDFDKRRRSYKDKYETYKH